MLTEEGNVLLDVGIFWFVIVSFFAVETFFFVLIFKCWKQILISFYY